MLIHVCIVSGCFDTIMAELSSCNRRAGSAKWKISAIWHFTEISADPCSIREMLLASSSYKWRNMLREVEAPKLQNQQVAKRAFVYSQKFSFSENWLSTCNLDQWNSSTHSPEPSVSHPWVRAGIYNDVFLVGNRLWQLSKSIWTDVLLSYP